MKKLFVHQPMFRLLSPVFSGIVVYLLLLLLNNNINQIQEEFFNAELYFCIGLCYLIQEFSRLLLLFFKRFSGFKLSISSIIIQVIISLILCVLLATLALNLFFEFILGFSITADEIYIFNSIFCVITFFYILLYVSHQYLYKINTEKLAQEIVNKKIIEEEFKDFKKGINPSLLFESLEFLLVLIKTNKEKSDDFLDHLATTYRYILSGKDKELTPISEEIDAVKNLVCLFNYLPNKSLVVHYHCNFSDLIVPGSLLFLLEKVVKTSIISEQLPLDITIDDRDSHIAFSYVINDKINTKLTISSVKEIIKTYKIYTLQELVVLEENNKRIIQIPKLELISEI